MKKKGQFYLIAAMLIIAIVLGLSAVSNYAKKNNELRIYDIKDELQTESAKVIDYEIASGDDKIENFTRQYSEYIGNDADIYFIRGKDLIEVYKYNNGIKEIIESFANTGQTEVVTIDGQDYEFKLKSGENFYFVISQEIGGDKYVVSG